MGIPYTVHQKLKSESPIDVRRKIVMLDEWVSCLGLKAERC